MENWGGTAGAFSREFGAISREVRGILGTPTGASSREFGAIPRDVRATVGKHLPCPEQLFLGRFFPRIPDFGLCCRAGSGKQLPCVFSTELAQPCPPRAWNSFPLCLPDASRGEVCLGFFFISRGPALFWSRPLGGTTKAGFSHPLNSGRAREAGAWRPGWVRTRGNRFGHRRDSPIWERWGKNLRELREGMPGSSIPAAFPLNSACIPRFLPPPADPAPSSCGS